MLDLNELFETTSSKSTALTDFSDVSPSSVANRGQGCIQDSTAAGELFNGIGTRVGPSSPPHEVKSYRECPPDFFSEV